MANRHRSVVEFEKNPSILGGIGEISAFERLLDQHSCTQGLVRGESSVAIRLISGLILIAFCSIGCGQGGPRPSDLGASQLDLGEPGIAWYTTWQTSEAEAKRSGRPIMFVAAATQCHGVSGVF